MKAPTTRLFVIPAGEELAETIEKLTKLDGWIEASGFVDGVEIRMVTDAADVNRALKGRWTLVSLLGPSSGPLTATLAKFTEIGTQIVGGHLVRARSGGVHLAVTPITREESNVEESSSDMKPMPKIVQQTTTKHDSKHQGTASWADVAAASEDRDDEPTEEPNPQQGDLVDHFSFGLCEVIRTDGERISLRDVRGPGRIREIALSMLNVLPPTTKNGRKIFRLLSKKTTG